MGEVRIIKVPFICKPWAATVFWPNTIFWRKDYPLNDHVLAHELRHVDQIREKGLVPYWLGYLWLLARFGYNDHPWEQEADSATSENHYRTWARKVIDNQNNAG